MADDLPADPLDALEEARYSEYQIRIDFEADSQDPARVFSSMASMIYAFQSIDSHLAAIVSSEIRSKVTLHSIDSGSLVTTLRTLIESIDDSDLRDLKWKRILGGFLVQAKKRIVAWLQKRERLESKKEVELLREELTQLAAATDIRWVEVYEPIPLRVLVFDLVLLSEAFIPLHEDDKVEFGTEKELLPVNTGFVAGDSAVDDLVTEKVDHSRRETVMRVKKPDYLGRSMWDLRADGHSVRAKILDERWLETFQNRQVLVRPGDSLRVVADRRTGYDDEGEVLFDQYEVIEVREVIQQQKGTQRSLFDSTSASEED